MKYNSPREQWTARFITVTLLSILLLTFACSKDEPEDPQPDNTGNPATGTPSNPGATTAPASNLNFISVWNVTDNKISLPLVANGTYDFTVDWGDGTTDKITTWDDIKKEHSYPENKEYTVTISGNIIEGWAFKGGDLYAKNFIDVKNWGRLSLGNTIFQFSNCVNLNFSATDAPDLSKTTSMSYMFSNATKFNSNINHWDVSKVTNMGSLFSGASAFNQPLDKWNVSNVTDMSAMFSGSTAFNQPLNSWNVVNVTGMAVMFNKALAFNQPLDKWNVGQVKYMDLIFAGASSFNQNISGWDVKNVSSYNAFSDKSNLSDENKPRFGKP